MTLSINTTSSGFSAVFGVSELVEIVRQFQPDFEPQKDQHDIHITLLTKSEARELEERGAKNPFDDASSSKVKLDDITPIGIGKTSISTFLVLVFNSANAARKKVNLPLKDFHITLSTRKGSSPEDSSHDFSTLIEPLAELATDEKTLEALSHHYFLKKDFEASYEYGKRLVRLEYSKMAQRRDQHPSEAPKGDCRSLFSLGIAAFHTHRYKVAMLCFGKCFDLLSVTEEDVRMQKERCLKKIGECSEFAEYGPTYIVEKDTDRDVNDLPGALFEPWSDELKECIVRLAEELPQTSLRIHKRLHTMVRVDSHPIELQINFRWIVPFKLAISARPENATQTQGLKAAGIRHIVTLCEEAPLPSTWFRPGGGITNTLVGFPDFHAPTFEQIDAFMRDAVQYTGNPDPSAGAMLVHCAGGQGRAGTMVACYLMAYGHSRASWSEPWSHAVMSSHQAIQHLRAIRPGSVESNDQEVCIKAYSDRMHKNRGPFSDLIEEPQDSLPTIQGSLDGADLLILCGLPGGGKTTFRNALATRDSTWTYVSGDEDGGRSVVIGGVSRQRPGTKFIVDRCNASVADRKELLALAHWASKPAAIFFDVDKELCNQRAQTRVGHPTLPPGGRVAAAIKQFSATLSPPTLKEGFVAIATITSFASSLELVRRIAGPINILKFPRTPHLISLGAETEDDISKPLANLSISPSSDAEAVITEKIDGANMGFSLSSNLDLLVQNRSHYINSGTHIQFKKLGLWMETHRAELFELLRRDESFPERYILYGEWMNAVHSVRYTALPDLFIAFDLYDRSTRTFCSRIELEELLQPTSIILTPVLHRGPLPSEQTLLKMIQEPSLFGAERREGVYVKIENSKQVLERGKVVRGDFIAGNEHWTKGKIVFNELARISAE